MLNMLMQYRVRSRLLLLGVLAILGLLLVSTLDLLELRSTMLEDRKVKVRNQVETAVGVIKHYQALSQSGGMNEAEAKKGAVEALRNVRYGGTEYFFIFDTGHVYQLLPTRPEFEGQNKADLKDTNGKLIIVEMVKAAQQGGGFVDYYFSKPGQEVPAPKISYAALVSGWNWVIGTGIYIDDVDQAFRQQAGSALAKVAILAALLVFLVWQITRSILLQLGGEPVTGIAIMNRVADGDLQVEVGQVPADSMLASLGQMVTRLRALVSEINKDAQRLNSQAGQVANSSREISKASQRQSDATTSMAAAMEELTVSINQISSGSSTAEETSQQATRLAREGVAKVGEATASMERISSSVTHASEQIRQLDDKAREISGIASEIKEIASQTNLLALNAAIEAARAGEQGRGFAVVADEVRKLAERTSVATVNIEQMLASVQSETVAVVGVMSEAIPQVEHGVQLARDVANLLTHIHEGAEATLVHLSEVAAATKEQGVASNNIAVQVEEISQMAEETSSTVRLAAESAGDIENVANSLNSMVSRFRV